MLPNCYLWITELLLLYINRNYLANISALLKRNPCKNRGRWK